MALLHQVDCPNSRFKDCEARFSKTFKIIAVHDYVGIKVQGERFNPATQTP
jgi:hypothetical protein